MNKITCFNELKKTITHEIGLTDKLLSLLKSESKTSPKDTDALLSVSDEKNKLLQIIEQHHSNRNAFIKYAGFSPDHQGTIACISACDHNNELSTLWKKFQAIVKECQHINQINGSTLDSSLRIVKQALSILYGEKIHENTYDASGHSKTNNMGRSIAKA